MRSVGEAARTFTSLLCPQLALHSSSSAQRRDPTACSPQRRPFLLIDYHSSLPLHFTPQTNSIGRRSRNGAPSRRHQMFKKVVQMEAERGDEVKFRFKALEVRCTRAPRCAIAPIALSLCVRAESEGHMRRVCSGMCLIVVV